MRNKKNTPDPNELTRRLINEIGLDIDKDKSIVDQDTGTKLAFNQKELKVIEGDERLPKGDIAFDPLHNPKLMTNLFSYYSKKVSEEEGYPEVSIFYPLPPDENGKSAVEVKLEDSTKIVSKPYCNDSLKMMDVLFQMSGDSEVDLSGYDEPIKPKQKKRK